MNVIKDADVIAAPIPKGKDNEKKTMKTNMINVLLESPELIVLG